MTNYPLHAQSALSTKFITEKQAAELTGLSRAYFSRARWAGTGPIYIKLPGRGGSVRYEKDELLNWFNTHKRTSTSDPGQQ